MARTFPRAVVRFPGLTGVLFRWPCSQLTDPDARLCRDGLRLWIVQQSRPRRTSLGGIAGGLIRTRSLRQLVGLLVLQRRCLRGALVCFCRLGSLAHLRVAVALEAQN